MKMFDLTQTISEDMSVYPGTAKPQLSSANTISADGFKGNDAADDQSYRHSYRCACAYHRRCSYFGQAKCRAFLR